MNNGVRANMGELTSMGNQVSQQAELYLNEINRIYGVVDSLVEKWEGTDNQQFAAKVNEYKPDMQNLGKVITDYGQFLKTTASTLSQVQSDIASATNKL